MSRSSGTEAGGMGRLSSRHIGLLFLFFSVFSAFSASSASSACSACSNISYSLRPSDPKPSGPGNPIRHR